MLSAYSYNSARYLYILVLMPFKKAIVICNHTVLLKQFFINIAGFMTTRSRYDV